MNIAVFGFGSVGRTLSRQALNMRVGVSAVADSSGVLLANALQQGFSAEDLSAAITAKEAGQSLASLKGSFTLVSPMEAVEALSAPGLVDSMVLTDCSAHDAPQDYLLPAQERRIPVALANKKPLTGPMADFKSLTKDRDLIRFESTVGAGLPVICTLRRLLDAGDSVKLIEGQLSGTLGYILSGLQKGEKFSSVVSAAKAQGFTEPDPRDDLSGLDVARKALILARCIGLEAELSQIDVEALYPAHMAEIAADEFMQRVGELDESVQERVDSAAAKEKRLRYAATISPEKITVGLVEVELQSPLASLDGTDNLISFTTGWYDSSPTVVKGPGAGLEVTAAGVLSDAMDLHGRKIRQSWGL